MSHDETSSGRARRAPAGRARGAAQPGGWHSAGVAHHPAALPADVTAFLTERHLATLTTLRPDGGPHVVAVGFTWDAERRLVRVITSGGSVKVANARAGSDTGGRAAVCQLDGRRWLTLEGPVRVSDDPAEVREAEQRYAGRYREPRPNPERVVILIEVDRVLGSAGAGPQQVQGEQHQGSGPGQRGGSGG